jgi:hypothetical protein
MRIVGKVNLPSVGLRGPTPDEVKASIESSRQAPRLAPTGVYRYRNHAEANAAMDRWIAEAMVRRVRELACKVGCFSRSKGLETTPVFMVLARHGLRRRLITQR